MELSKNPLAPRAVCAFYKEMVYALKLAVGGRFDVLLLLFFYIIEFPLFFFFHIVSDFTPLTPFINFKYTTHQ